MKKIEGCLDSSDSSFSEDGVDSILQILMVLSQTHYLQVREPIYKSSSTWIFVYTITKHCDLIYFVKKYICTHRLLICQSYNLQRYWFFIIKIDLPKLQLKNRSLLLFDNQALMGMEYCQKSVCTGQEQEKIQSN